MQLKEIGEFGLISRIKRQVKVDTSVVKGIGDDCAVLKFSAHKYQLFTCDMLVEGVDFLAQESKYLVGRKAVAVSLSDIAACGGLPAHCLVALGVPKSMPLKFIDQLLKGIVRTARQYKVNLVGGDLSRADKLIIDVAMLGWVEKKNLVLRSGAKQGDVIFVSGKLGGAQSGKHLRFNPRLKESRWLVKNFHLSAMIDISDGLSQDLGHILSESKVGAILYEGLIPLSPQARNLREALSAGEDFELLFTASRQEALKICNKKRNTCRVIGEIVDKQYGLRLIDKQGRERKIKPAGFRHF